MNTPIYDFIDQYRSKAPVRAHMPGHKGISAAECGFGEAYKYDITEIEGADVLFEAKGIIAESERNAASLFGTAGTFYSAAGSTLCIQAMLASVCGKDRAFICARNSHKSVMNSCVLLGLEPCWIYPEYTSGSAVSGEITPEAVEKAIMQYSEKKPACVFITSPDYLGRVADIKGISEVCRKHGLPLLVDNAHGAYLAFLEENIHPIHLGADMCCDSAHKTLPVLTGGAYLHVKSEEYVSRIKQSMALFGSTSPSYLIMASLDLCNKYLSESFRTDLAKAAERVKALKERLSPVWNIQDSEPMKLTVFALMAGLTGYQLAEQLRERGVEPEYADSAHVVLMFSASNTAEDLERTAVVFESVKMPRIYLELPEIKISELQRAMLPGEAFFADKERINVEDSVGRIAAESLSVCPPCVPVAVPGEIIDENAVKILKMYSIFKINVIK